MPILHDGVIDKVETFNHMDNPYGFCLLGGRKMIIPVKTEQRNYSVIVEKGVLRRLKEYVGERDVFVVSDQGVPTQWLDMIFAQYPDAKSFIFKDGEASKNWNTLEELLKKMMEAELKRGDIVIAIGGGVVGDMAGFASSIYMRGIEYVNIPTTTLSQIDSSIGGKTSIDFCGVKNSIGTFWQPSLVLADLSTLETLSSRHFYNGLVEAVKVGLIYDEELFKIFEQDDYTSHLEEIIVRSIEAKKKIVEEDERDNGIRQILNFGHTFGHGLEAYHQGNYLHGECVGMGMMMVLKDEGIKERLQDVLSKLKIPTTCTYDPETVFEYIRKDKKSNKDFVNVIQVNEVGHAEIEKWSYEQIHRRLIHE